MPDEIIPKETAPQHFEQALETDMDRLAGEIMRHKEALEHVSADHREVLKEAIRAIQPTDVPVAPAPADGGGSAYLPGYAAGSTPEMKLEIEYLVDLALKQGIGKANAAAQKANPFILDAFHDALAGKLYPELQRRKILK